MQQFCNDKKVAPEGAINILILLENLVSRVGFGVIGQLNTQRSIIQRILFAGLLKLEVIDGRTSRKENRGIWDVPDKGIKR